MEAEVTGRLEHPGVVPVYAMGTWDDGRQYYAMRFIDGHTLDHAIQQLRQRPERADTTAVETAPQHRRCDGEGDQEIVRNSVGEGREGQPDEPEDVDDRNEAGLDEAQVGQ